MGLRLLVNISLNDYKIVKDPIHGYVKVYRYELPIVDTFVYQRLRRIKQLAVADLVYPGAVHTRFSHSLGVAHLTQFFVEEALGKEDVPKDEVLKYIVFMRLVALLHDVGHGPFSHIFEDYVLIPRGVSHEVMGARIVEKSELAEHVEKVLEECGFSLKDLVQALESTSPDAWPLNESLGRGSARALFYIIKGAFSTDIIDYLLRDSYYTGVGYGQGIDWMRIAHCTRLVGSKLAIESRATEVLDQLIMARLWMFSTVYYHKTVRAATRYAGLMLHRIDREKVLDFDEAVREVESYVILDDNYVLIKGLERGFEEARDLLSRRIPYKSIAEHRVSMPDLARPLEMLLTMSSSIIEQSIEEQLRKKGIELVRGRDYFVDTPKLPLNPMLSDDTIYVHYPHTNELIRKSVLELTWFHIPKTVAVIRLYVDRRRVRDPETLVKAFKDVFKSSEIRSFY